MLMMIIQQAVSINDFRPLDAPFLRYARGQTDIQTRRSCPRVGLTHGLGWVHYSKITEILQDYVNAFRARIGLDKICLRRAVKFVSWSVLEPVRSKFFHL